MGVTVRRGRKKCRVICFLDFPWQIGSSPLKKVLYIYLVLGLRVCGLFPGCGEQELLSSFGAWASHYGGLSLAEHGLQSTANSHGTRAQLL